MLDDAKIAQLHRANTKQLARRIAKESNARPEYQAYVISVLKWGTDDLSMRSTITELYRNCPHWFL